MAVRFAGNGKSKGDELADPSLGLAGPTVTFLRLGVARGSDWRGVVGSIGDGR